MQLDQKYRCATQFGKDETKDNPFSLTAESLFLIYWYNIGTTCTCTRVEYRGYNRTEEVKKIPCNFQCEMRVPMRHPFVFRVAIVIVLKRDEITDSKHTFVDVSRQN
jgi:hypothetical protein